MQPHILGLVGDLYRFVQFSKDLVGDLHFFRCVVMAIDGLSPAPKSDGGIAAFSFFASLSLMN
jgi:hypothetical protein